jgi:hypothetical protein
MTGVRWGKKEAGPPLIRSKDTHFCNLGGARIPIDYKNDLRVLTVYKRYSRSIEGNTELYSIANGSFRIFGFLPMNAIQILVMYMIVQ